MPKKKQQKPLYRKEETLGEEREFSPSTLVLGYGDENMSDGERLMMCPYTEFIPLVYLLSNNHINIKNPLAYYIKQYWNIVENNLIKFKKFDAKWQKRILSTFPSRNLTNDKGRMKHLSKKDVDGWIKFDEPISLRVLEQNGWNVGYRSTIMEYFNIGTTNRFNQRSYSGAISPYSLYLRDNTTLRREHRYIPHMLAVVLPENYLYVKHHLLVHNTIPLDKIVVLVDKALDETSFRPTAFRGLYKDMMKEKVLKSCCDVWKVPHEFIMEKCFLGNYKLKEENILRRKKEIEGIIDEFYESFREKELSMAETQSAASSWLDSALEDMLGTPITSNPLHGMSVTSTSGLTVESDSGAWTWQVPSQMEGLRYITSEARSELYDGLGIPADRDIAHEQAVMAERALALHNMAPEVNWNPGGITSIQYEGENGEMIENVEF